MMLLLLILLPLPALSVNERLQDEQIMAELSYRSKNFVNAVISANVLGVRADMDSTLMNTLTQDTVKTISTDLMRKGGKFSGLGEPHLFRGEGGTIISMVPVMMGRENFYAQLVFTRISARADVRTFTILPWQDNLEKIYGRELFKRPDSAIPLPPWANPKLQREEKIKFPRPNSESDLHHAIMSLPLTASSASPAGLVILIPPAVDSDEKLPVEWVDKSTQRFNRVAIHRDLSIGLAARGIATIRMQGFQPEHNFPPLTLSDEDALDANLSGVLKTLDQYPEIDQKRIYLAGYQGAADRILKLELPSSIAGFIFLEPSTVENHDHRPSKAPVRLAALRKPVLLFHSRFLPNSTGICETCAGQWLEVANSNSIGWFSVELDWPEHDETDSTLFMCEDVTAMIREFMTTGKPDTIGKSESFFCR